MRRAIAFSGGLTVVLGLCIAASAPAAAATTEEVLAKLVANEGQVKTFEADMTFIAKSVDKNVTTTGHIATQIVLKDGQRAGVLMNMKQKMTIGEGTTSDTLMVNDGEFLWTEMPHPQMGVAVIKNKPGAGKAQTADTKQMRDRYDLKLVGEEEFDGQQMWVLEGTPKNKAPAAPAAVGPHGMGQQGEPGKVRFYIGQKDLMCHRFRDYDKDGNEQADMQFTNLKVNGALDPALFKYTPPEGALIMDMTKGMPDFSGMMKDLPNPPSDEGGE